MFEEWRVASLMPAANGPSPVARLGSLPTLPKRVDCCAICGRCMRIQLALLVQDFFLIAPASSNSTLLGRVAGEERTRGEGLFGDWPVEC